MKKTVHILLIFLLLLQTGGTIIYYNVQQSLLRNEIQPAIANGDIECQKLVMSLADYEKNKVDAHEMYINGKLFDIKSVSIADKEVTVYAAEDLEEEKIIAKIKKVLKSDPQQSRIPDPLIELLTSFYILPEFYSLCFANNDCNQLFVTYSDLTSPGIADIRIPPPRPA